jgi:serine protease
MGRASRYFLVLALGGAFFLLPVRARDTLRVAALRQTARSQQRFVPGELIVKFKDSADDQRMVGDIQVIGGRWARRSAFGPRYLVSLDADAGVPDAVARLASMPEVDYAEPNGVVRAYQAAGRFTPNDRLFPLQWHMKMVDAERTWAIQKGDPSVVVAVLDTGIAYEDFGPFRKAPDFGTTTFVTGFNVITGSSHANDDNFHGTHVASTIAEATNNSEGVAGLAFGCALMPVKVLDREGFGSFFDVAEGIDFATNFTQGGTKPVKVINLSLGGDSTSLTLQQAVDRAVTAGIVVVAAAGNESQATVGFPASLPNVIAVGAVDGRKRKAPYSNFGRELDVVAPGGDIFRDDDGDGRPDGVLQQTFDPDTAELLGRFDDFGYFFVVGTSQATPHVSAVAALLVRQGITNPAAVQAAIEQTAEDLGDPGRDDAFGHGLIRPSLALKGLGLNQ